MVHGFPKSLNIGLAMDKKNGVESEIIGYSGSMMNFRDTGAKQKELSGVNKLSFGQIENSERKENPIYEVKNKWKGWGTALKPSFEPIIVARKPFDGSLVENIMINGVGGINIDECRVPAKQGEYDIRHYTNEDCFQNTKPKESKFQVEVQPDGRFPANTILTYDETDKEEVCGRFPDSKGKGHFPKNNKNGNSIFNTNNLEQEEKYLSDSGSAVRYFYCAKASRKDRDEGLGRFNKVDGGSYQFRQDGSLDGQIPSRKNIHPTVKPTELMQYLVRLVTPKGGKVLDPFMGSGSTGKAVAFENRERDAKYEFVGVEKEQEYYEISKARIKWASSKYVYLYDDYDEYNDTEEQENNIRKGRLW